MKKLVLFFITLFSIFAVTNAQEDSMYIYEPDSLVTASNRFEAGLLMGYSSIANYTNNQKTIFFSDYNESLTGGLNTGIYLGYNFSVPLFTRLVYQYRTTSASQLVTVFYGNDSSEVMHIADQYQFHQLEVEFGYRIRVIPYKLFLSPMVGVGGLYFRNEATMDVDYLQKSTGITYTGGFGLDYFVSNHLGLSANVQYCLAKLNNHQLAVQGDSYIYDSVADDQFSFADFQVRLFYLF